MAVTIGACDRKSERQARPDPRQPHLSPWPLSDPSNQRDDSSRAATSDAEGLFHEPGWVWRRFGRVGWWVRRGWEQVLLGPRGLPLQEWRAQGRLETIKTGPHRVVYRASLPAGAVYIKHYKIPSWREMLRQWFRRGKGRNEAKRALRLASLGIPTITPIALGEQRKNKFLFENYLISPEIAGAVPLDEFVETHLQTRPFREQVRLRHALSVEVARLTARLHDARFVHQDFHPGNILVRETSAGTIELAMIDLDALRVRRRLTWRGARANLALLNHYFWCRSERSDRHRFLKAYLDFRGHPRDKLENFALAIEQSTRCWAERLWRRWGRRCRGNNKYFRVHRAPGAWAVASRLLEKAEARAIAADPESIFSHSETRIIKHSRTTTVAETTLTVDGAPASVIFKRFNCKKALDPVFALFRPTRGWRAWQGGQHLASRGIPTPQNLLYIRRRADRSLLNPLGILAGCTYVATITAQPSSTLYDHIHADLAPLPACDRMRQTRRLARLLARAVRVLHERSLAHRDLKAANVLVIPQENGAISLSFIDLVGVELRHPLPRSRRIQNMARLYLSLEKVPWATRTDALRFLKSYLAGSCSGRTEWKGIWREVARASNGKREQNRRRGRILS